ncbi:MAG: Rrf2 family transcriptional regulator [Bacillota bacterium]|nr:Rrf2 family transcriptional regulator [Bacillota bacterium]
MHREILRTLAEAQASYAHPVSSERVAQALNLTPSYVREQVQVLRSMALVDVRRGRGGGYFLRNRRWPPAWRQCAGWA